MSFNQIYVPILSRSSADLYLNLFFQSQINSNLGISSYELDKFLRNYNLDESEFNGCLKELEQFNLIKLYVRTNVNSETEFLVKLEEVRSMKSSMKDEGIRGRLMQTVTPEKYLELQLLVEDVDYGYEVDLNVSAPKKVEVEIAKQENIIDEETYCNFYNGVFRALNSEFSLCDNVLRIIRDYHVIENKITMEKLQRFACLSVKESGGKFSISSKHLQFLVKQEINGGGPREEFNCEEYDDFWRKLLIMGEGEVQSRFERLFSRHDSEGIYKLLTAKGKVPATLNKWIGDCIRSKNLNFPILNASISFVKTLLNKIPINYLIKLTDTLNNNGISGEREFLNHIRRVIIHDSENQNRINAVTEIPKEEIQRSSDHPSQRTGIPLFETNEPRFFTKKPSF